MSTLSVILPPGFNLRLARPSDEAALYEVCLLTGDGGADASALYSDPQALGRIYVGPYLRLEPELAFAAEDHAGICGYVLGARDSRQFWEAYRREWLPILRARFARPQGDPARWSPTEKVYELYYEPDIFWPEPYTRFPSHLHIDLLERARGRGLGRAMVEELLERLRKSGSPGVHLGMDERNERAEGFYRALGFKELMRKADVVYFGKELC